MNVGLVAHDGKKNLMQNLCIAYQDILKKDYYKKIIKKYEQLLDEITANISNKKLVQDFKEAEIDAYTIQLIKAYKKGFEDSLIILEK